jgi:ribonuclease P protein component
MPSGQRANRHAEPPRRTDLRRQDKAGHSFKRCYRLTRATDYGRVFRQPYRLSDALFTLLARPNGLGYARLGLAISKKNIKAAVARNRIKRLIRESFRQHRALLPDVDIIVMAKRGANGQTNQSVTRSLQAHWQSLTD